MTRQRNSKNRWLTCVVAIAFGLIAAGAGFSSPAAAQSAKPESTKLNIGLAVHAISYLPVWVADQKGFLKEEGITDVKVLAFRGDADVLQALVGGTVDMNVSSLTGLVNAIKSGQKFKAVWSGFNMPMFDWYANPKFKTIAETKGGRYAVSKFGSLTDQLTRYALREAGLDPNKDVKILQLGGSATSLAAMEAGKIDAAIIAAPGNYAAADKGFVKLMSQKTQIAPDWPLHVVFAKEDYIATHPNTIKAFLRSVGRGIEWIRANPDEAAKIASKMTKFKVSYCRRFLKEYEDDWKVDGALPGKGLKVFWQIAQEAGDVKAPWPNDKWLDSSFLSTQDQWRK